MPQRKPLFAKKFYFATPKGIFGAENGVSAALLREEKRVCGRWLGKEGFLARRGRKKKARRGREKNEALAEEEWRGGRVPFAEKGKSEAIGYSPQ